jgi:cytochrome c-type biogenesis protein CcmH/NrfG
MLARNRPLEAIAALEQAIQLVPESADLYTGLAAAQRRAGNSTAAGKSKREATRLRP